MRCSANCKKYATKSVLCLYKHPMQLHGLMDSSAVLERSAPSRLRRQTMLDRFHSIAKLSRLFILFVIDPASRS
jgi:hypothetical protein